MSTLQEELSNVLHGIRGAGTFFVSGWEDYVWPGIELKSGEELAFPLPPAQVEAIKECAEVAPFGMGEKTLIDESVRKCWQIDTSELDFSNPTWDELIEKIVKKVSKDLGVEGEVIAEPYKLLLYEEGGFFLPHRDTEKIPRMFGTLLVGLPSRHTGGELVVRHSGREERIKFCEGNWRESIGFAAFFADCEHEVKPVKSGSRLCLAYNLATTGKNSDIPDPSPGEAAEPLVPVLKELKKDRPRKLTAILLDHSYTEEHFSVRHLKGDDRARVKALFAAAEEAGFTVHLGLVSLYQMGELDGIAHSFECGWDISSGVMGEIYEEYLSIDLWRTPADKEVNLGCYSIEKSSLIDRDGEFGKGEPDEEAAEGPTGNAGCTMEYWYRRAAIVLWDREDDIPIRTEYNFPKAIHDFRIQSSEKEIASNPKFLKLGEALVQKANERWEAAQLRGFPPGPQTEGLVPLLSGIVVSGCRDLLEKMSPMNDAILEIGDVKMIEEMMNSTGEEVIRSYVDATDDEVIPQRLNSLFSILAAGLKKKGKPAKVTIILAHRLTELLEAQAQFKEGYRRSLLNPLALPERFHIAIAASFLLTEKSARNELFAQLISDDDLNHLKNHLAPALQKETFRLRCREPGSLWPRVLERVISTLEKEVDLPLEPYPDWRRPFPEAAKLEAWIPREILGELESFVRDPDSSDHRFQYRQDIRRSLENYIRNHALDLNCRTERKGSPHQLICSKNDSSYQNAKRVRASDKNLLRTLKTLQSKEAKLTE